MFSRKGARTLVLQTRAVLLTATSEISVQWLHPTSWERTVTGHVSMDTSHGSADWLPLLSPLGCPHLL